LFVTIGVFAGALILEAAFRYLGKRFMGIAKKIERDFLPGKELTGQTTAEQEYHGIN
jgi:hypothetical protein